MQCRPALDGGIVLPAKALHPQRRRARVDERRLDEAGSGINLHQVEIDLEGRIGELVVREDGGWRQADDADLESGVEQVQDGVLCHVYGVFQRQFTKFGSRPCDSGSRLLGTSQPGETDHHE